MCGHFDLFDLASHHDTNLVTKDCQEKRNILRNIMTDYGFNFLQE
jgi:D-alanyl-D-alanine dipeptidase